MKPLTALPEVNHFLQRLFSTLLPTITPSGKKIYEVVDTARLLG